MNRLVITLSVVAVLSAAVFGFLTQKRLAETPARVPELVAATDIRPDFELPDTTGTQRRLSEWDGKTIVVNFWATWCAPCRDEIPVLIEAQNDYKARGLQIIGVAVDEMAPVREYAEEMQINYPVLVGGQEALDVADSFGVDVVALPFSIVIRPDLGVARIHLGELNKTELLDLIQAHL